MKITDFRVFINKTVPDIIPLKNYGIHVPENIKTIMYILYKAKNSKL